MGYREFLERKKGISFAPDENENENEQPRDWLEYLERKKGTSFAPDENEHEQPQHQPHGWYERDKYEEGIAFMDSEDEDYWYEYLREKQTKLMAIELELLKGAISFGAPPPPPPQQQLDAPSRPVLTSFLTKNGCIDHSLVSARAVYELSALALDKDGLFWTDDGLNQPLYQRTFPRLKWKRTSSTPDDDGSSWTHASRASATVKMDHTLLAKKFTRDKYWQQLFPSIVSASLGLRSLSPGSSSRNPDGSVQLIQIQLQATTPLVPERNFVILRTCKKIDHLTWVVADVSVDSLLNVGYPCGCLIQGMADGLSQVTWVEHLEFKESYLDPKFYNDLCGRGFAFGAERWVDCLERSCERRSFHQTKSYFFGPPLVGQDRVSDSWTEYPWEWEKRCVMRFSKRMVRDFCLNIRPFGWKHRQSCVYDGTPRPQAVRIMADHNPYHDDPNETVLLASTTFTLPHSPEFVLKILGDERRRHELDASGRIGQLTEVACYQTGSDPRNKISVQANQSLDNELLLQEVSVSRSGSLVVWSLIRSDSFDLARLGQNPQRFPLIGLSGFAISANSRQNTANGSSNTGGGSYVTLGLQHEARRKESWPKLSKAIAKCILGTVRRLVEALNNSKDEGDCGSTNKRMRYTTDQPDGRTIKLSITYE